MNSNIITTFVNSLRNKFNTQYIMIFKLKKCLITFLLLFVGFLTINATQIVVLADIHVTPGNKNEEKLKEAVEEINKGDGDIVILAGDLSNEGSDEQLLNVKSILDKINKPFFIVPGNHENNWSQSACKTFIDLWGNDRFVTEIDDLVLVGINCGPFMKMGDGHIKQEDLIWLDNTLSSHKGKRVISINHYPINKDLDNCSDYIKVLEKYPVAVHLCGHYHTFRHYKGGDIDGLMNRALDMKKGNYGYTIIEVVNDSIKQWDKQLNIDKKLITSFRINDNIKPLVEENNEKFTIPSNVKIDLVYKDNASIFTRVGYDKNNIYFGNSLGYLKSINKKSGKENWNFKTDASLFSRPAVSEKYIILPTADKRLIWINKTTGKMIYQLYAQGPYVADGVVCNNILYQGGYKLFEAWDINKMQPIWRCETNNYCQAAPTVTDKDVTFGAWDTNIRNVDVNTGKLNWAWNNERGNMLGPGNCVPVVTDDKVIMVAPDRYMTAFDRKSGKMLWRSNKYKVRESLGCSLDKKVAYAKTMDGELIAVSTEGNEYNPLWVVDAELGYEHAPCIVIENKGLVFLGSRAGIMSVIDPKAKKLIWKYRLGTSEFNGWEIDENGDLYTSLIEGTIWRISFK